jgi:prevent-host-death family protein
MYEIGIRELKANLSSVLHRVDEGEEIRVTRRGRLVAEIVPAGAARGDDRLRELLANGRIALPARPLPARAPRLAKSDRSATAIVLADRADER